MHNPASQLMADDGFGPLSGFRLLDLTTVIMGPFGTRILADMGADVIKVEPPEGDTFRSYGPFVNTGMGGSILNLHRNKRSVMLDLKDPDAREALDELMRTADVLVHNLRPTAARKLGLDWEGVSRIKPDIILCEARGFASNGPYGQKAAYDDLMQAGSGFAALFAQVDGTPRYAPTAWCDKVAGQAIAYSILGALIQKMRTGAGRSIEVPMFEIAIDFMLVEHFGAMTFDPPKGAPGFSRQLAPSRKPYRTADGWACILPYSDRNWRDFFMYIDRADLCDELRFAKIESRSQHIDELYRLIEQEAVLRSTAQWMKFCDGVSIPALPVLSFEEIEHDAHVLETGMFHSLEHPSEGGYKLIRPPVRLAEPGSELRHHAPRLGEHTSEILAGLDLREDLLAKLVGQAAGLAASAPRKAP